MSLTFPAQFILVAAMNPCPCGHAGDTAKPCHCAPDAVARYLARLSGPLLDRIDIHLPIPAVPPDDLAPITPAEPSAVIRARVEAARVVQLERFRGLAGVYANAHMGSRELRRHCRLADAAEGLLRRAVARLALSARAYHRVLRVARTIADLAGEHTIGSAHVSEAIQYRSVERVAGLARAAQPQSS